MARLAENVNRDVVRVGKNFIHAGAVTHSAAQAPRAFYADEGVIAQHFHLQAFRRRVGHDRTDCAQTDHAQRFAPNLRAGELPLAFLHQLGDRIPLPFQSLRPLNAAGYVPSAQHQAADDQLRHGVGIGAGGIENRNPPPGAFVDGDIVGARACSGNGQQALRQLPFVHIGGTNQNAFRHRFFLADKIIFRAQFFVDHIGDGVQRLNFVHQTCSFSKAFITSTSAFTPSTGMAL